MTVKTIYINGRFLAQPLTGVQRYSHELVRAWDELLDCGEIDRHAYELVVLAPKSAPAQNPWRHVRLVQAGRFDGNLWEQIDLPWLARGGLLFSPGNIGPYFHPNQAVTLHDASVFAVPEAYSRLFRWKYRLIMRRMGRIARQIFTVSEFSRGELSRYLNIPPERITVVYPGKEHILRVEPDERILDRYGLRDRPFLFAVSSNSPHKNFATLLAAIRQMGDQEFKFVIAGGTFARVFQATGMEELPANVIRVGYVSDGELRALYEHAQAFVFPSLYEGFGLPPLEAMACGCPVICSNAASLPEVCGDAAVYFEPQDVETLVHQINQLFCNSFSRDFLLRRGIDRANCFSWKRTGSLTEIFKNLITVPESNRIVM